MQVFKFSLLAWLCLLSFISISGCNSLSVAISPKTTKVDLRKIKKVAISLDAASGGGFGGMRIMGNGQEPFSDYFTAELIKMGIDVVERDQLDKVMKEQALNLGGVTESEKAIAAGRILAIDAIITGTVGTNTEYSIPWFFVFGGGFREVVSSASIKMVDVEKGKVLLIITSAGRRDSVPKIARKFAKVLRETIEGD